MARKKLNKGGRPKKLRKGGRMKTKTRMAGGGRSNGCPPGMTMQNGQCVPAGGGGYRKGGRPTRKMQFGGHSHGLPSHQHYVQSTDQLSGELTDAGYMYPTTTEGWNLGNMPGTFYSSDYTEAGETSTPGTHGHPQFDTSPNSTQQRELGENTMARTRMARGGRPKMLRRGGRPKMQAGRSLRGPMIENAQPGRTTQRLPYQQYARGGTAVNGSPTANGGVYQDGGIVGSATLTHQGLANQGSPGTAGPAGRTVRAAPSPRRRGPRQGQGAMRAPGYRRGGRTRRRR